MPLSFQEISQLRRIVKAAERAIKVANALIEHSPRVKRGPAPKPAASSQKGKSGKRIRRTGAALADFRKSIKAGRKKGVPVAKLATQFGVSQAYIYQLK